jgi:hypothetical protein
LRRAAFAKAIRLEQHRGIEADIDTAVAATGAAARRADRWMAINGYQSFSPTSCRRRRTSTGVQQAVPQSLHFMIAGYTMASARPMAPGMVWRGRLEDRSDRLRRAAGLINPLITELVTYLMTPQRPSSGARPWRTST